MILVSAGTVGFPFHRLIDASLESFKEINDQKVIIQSGVIKPRKVPQHIVMKQFFPPMRMLELYRDVEWIISAAGEASVLQIIHYAQNRPLLMPRRKCFGEHVDDQQVRVARKSAELGWVDWVDSIDDLKRYIKSDGLIHPQNIAKRKLTANSDETVNCLEKITSNMKWSLVQQFE